jgi:hypothetical protein
MIFNVLTIFPDMFEGILRNSILKRAIERDLIKVNLVNIRDYSKDKHKKQMITHMVAGMAWL